LVVAVAAQVVALAAVLVGIVQAVAVVVMAQVPAQSHALAVVAMLVVVAPVIHVQHALPIRVLRVLLTHVQAVLQVHALQNQSLAVSVATLAVAKHDSPQSSPFCMESSRFR
jgi:hypothetical protein